MKLLNKIQVTSLTKAVQNAKIYGNLNLHILSLYNLYIYYINFTEGKKEFNSLNRELKETISKLKYKFPDIICNYKLQINNKFTGIEIINTPPVVDDVTIDLNGSFTYVFKLEDFTNNFQDAQNDSWSTILIYPNDNLEGILFFNNIRVNSVLEIDLNNIQNLTYVLRNNNISSFEIGSLLSNITSVNNREVNDSFVFKIADNNANKLYSNFTTVNIVNSQFIENFPAEIGDITITVDNRVTTILTLNMFTNLMSPPYSDPENDDIDAIRIDAINPNNQGIFYLNGIPISVGDIITDQDLIEGNFIHIGPDTDAFNFDRLDFSARDKGSLIWVS